MGRSYRPSTRSLMNGTPAVDFSLTVSTQPAPSRSAPHNPAKSFVFIAAPIQSHLGGASMEFFVLHLSERRRKLEAEPVCNFLRTIIFMSNQLPLINTAAAAIRGSKPLKRLARLHDFLHRAKAAVLMKCAGIGRGLCSLAAFAAVLALASCSGGNDSATNTASSNSSSKKIVIRGSNTIGEELAPNLIADYKKDHPDMAFDTEYKGTAYGFGSLLGGACDIAGASKPIAKEQEEIAQERKVQVKEYVLGSYAVAVIVNPANTVANLTTNQVAALFTGTAQNWKDAGGADAPVHLYARDPISGTHIGFKELAMNNKAYGAGAQFLTSYQAIADAVAKDPGGVGYCGLDLVKRSDIKAVAIDGVAPGVETVNQQKYPYARVLRLYTNEKKEAAEVKKFVDFALSNRGQQIVAQMGYAPKP
ncbi:MAG: hypothetical protein C5B50_23415 [Verrucomicrobia bacterium]|nr:MAG: hypothetical protein C5B50_23415 [Verrucomicrobiota bacterium]